MVWTLMKHYAFKHNKRLLKSDLWAKKFCGQTVGKS
jgi:hypothetical protein